MKIGVTGHQARPGIDWSWVATTVRAELTKAGPVTRALSCLAVGSDQVFAQVAIELGIPVLAVLPMEGYERFFEGKSLIDYHRLLSRSKRLQLNWAGDPECAFYEAGKFVVDNCDVLFAIWDGEPAEGPGGTADVVRYARENGRSIVQIDPISKRIMRRVTK